MSLHLIVRKFETTPLWKMREFRVIFMYYALPLLWRFPEHLTDAHDMVNAEDEESLIHDLPTGGEALKTAMKLLLRGLHLTKGFSSEVAITTIY